MLDTKKALSIQQRLRIQGLVTALLSVGGDSSRVLAAGRTSNGLLGAWSRRTPSTSRQQWIQLIRSQSVLKVSAYRGREDLQQPYIMENIEYARRSLEELQNNINTNIVLTKIKRNNSAILTSSSESDCLTGISTIPSFTLQSRLVRHQKLENAFIAQSSRMVQRGTSLPISS